MLWTAITLAVCAIAPQEDPVVARFVYPDGQAGIVTLDDLARDAAVRHRRSENGELAQRVLVDRQLVATEAAAAGVEPNQAEIDACMDGIRAQVERAGQTLGAFLDARRMSREDFERNFVRFQVAHQRLVMRALELDDPAEVSPELQKLWLEEARTRHRVVTDEAKLPAGIVAVVDDRRFDMTDLGRELLPNISDEERAKYVRRIVLRELLRQRAERAGISVTEEDTRAEIDARRERIEGDPRYRGIRYEDWLQTTQGMTVDELARSPQMVATVQQQRLVDLEFPDAELRRRLQESRDQVLRDHGEQRAISIVLLRGLEKPNEIVTRTFDQARDELLAVRARLDAGESFLRVAQIHSEDPYSKVRGGALGEFARGASEVPDAVLEAAFGLEPLTVSEPVRVPQGYCLVRVTKVIPPPDEASLLASLREDLAQKFLADALDAAKIEIVR